ncbi:MAG: DUF2905 domain-containing protein [Gemmatimonadaceae bacterium]
MLQRSVGLTVVLVGLAVVLVGLLVSIGALSWFGRLPGDVRVERPGVRLYFPITSAIVVSLGVTALVALVRRFWP